ACGCAYASQADAHETPEKKEPPRVAMCVPLAVTPGQTAKVVIRGWHLEGSSEVRTSQENVTCKILTQGAANVPGQQNADQIGNQQVEVEVAVPAEVGAAEITLTVV